ncbi:DUF4332 domain-containing protein, partial [Thermoproteota archaeon]
VYENIKKEEIQIEEKTVNSDYVKPSSITDVLYDRNVTIIDGVGKGYAKKLRNIGIIRLSDFMRLVNESHGLDKITKETGIYRKLLEKWSIQADFLRIHGINHQNITKLIAIGIQSTKDLAESNPNAIHQELLEKNAYSEIPSIGMLQRWVRLAKKINQ